MTAPAEDVAATRAWYERAADELAGTSALQVSWARAVAADERLLGLIGELPREHRQPSLLFAVAAFCGAPPTSGATWLEFVEAHWPAIGAEAARRRTQTNEVGRCIPLMLGLSALPPGPMALLELGASAGLCLLPDRYSYRLGDGPVVGTGPPLLEATTSGDGMPPLRLPDIVWRAGIDLDPLDPGDADDVRWLEALLPPDRPERRARLRSALATARAEARPFRVVAGDALAALAQVAADAPSDATLVVASLGTAVYLPPADRAALPDAVAALAAHRRAAHLLAFEPTAAIPGVAEALTHLTASDPTPFVLSLDGHPLAHATAHGDRVSWLSPRAGSV